VTYARQVRAETGRGGDLAVVAPVGVPAAADAAAVAAAAGRWREAGATAFHVGIAAGSFAEYLDRLAWVASEVMPRV
jgi:hypothetical protein